MKRITAMVVGCALLASCGGKQEQLPDWSQIPVTNVTGIEYKINNDFFYFINPLQVYGDNIGIGNVYSGIYNYGVAQFRGDSAVMIEGICRRGQGPGEFIYASFGVKNDSTLLIMSKDGSGPRAIFEIPLNPYPDMNYKTWTQYDMDKIKQKDGTGLKISGNDFIYLGDSKILFTGTPYSEENHIFTILDYKTQKYTALDYWPEDEYEGPDAPKNFFYMINSKLLNSGKRFAYQCGEGQFAFIFEIDGKKVKVIRTLFDKKAKYRAKEDNRNYGVKHTNFLRLAANDKYICAMPLEKNIDGEKKGDWLECRYGNEIYVFDWDGNPVKHLMLDHIGMAIGMLQKENTLLLTEENKEGNTSIWRYQLD
ncbi:MAG: TolB-like 6-bladed beta-propeller domain-containing protein [Paramuribaculum sp.]|nr:TolB-like 6-bladed beta-propeller domain-containing protein [Paramuribaculum sp.]